MPLRGVGTFSYSIGIESAVSVISDDVPVIEQLQAFSDLGDIEKSPSRPGSAMCAAVPGLAPVKG